MATCLWNNTPPVPQNTRGCLMTPKVMLMCPLVEEGPSLKLPVHTTTQLQPEYRQRRGSLHTHTSQSVIIDCRKRMELVHPGDKANSEEWNGFTNGPRTWSLHCTGLHPMSFRNVLPAATGPEAGPCTVQPGCLRNRATRTCGRRLSLPHSSTLLYSSGDWGALRRIQTHPLFYLGIHFQNNSAT